MTKRKPLKLASLATLMILLFIGCLYQKSTALAINPYLPEWEHIPDGEPYVFEDPEHPGKERIYIYGSHDILLWSGFNRMVGASRRSY